MNADDLREGALIALGHSAQLLEDAALLYSGARAASSFVLAVSAREEVGRCNLLWKQADKMAAGETVAPRVLAKRLDDHVAKLRAGPSVAPIPMPPKAMAAWKAAIEANDGATSLAIMTEARKLVKQKLRREPSDLHQRRLDAQYVNPLPDGAWSTPSDIGRNEARVLIHTVLAGIANALIRALGDVSVAKTLARTGRTLPDMGAFTIRVFAALTPVSA
jgi:AbiV family abortive infection protein